MGGLKPVDDRGKGSQNNNDYTYIDGQGENARCEVTEEDISEDAQGKTDKQRKAFGVLDGMAYVIYDDGSVDIGADGKAIRIPSEIMEIVVDDYNQYL